LSRSLFSLERLIAVPFPEFARFSGVADSAKGANWENFAKKGAKTGRGAGFFDAVPLYYTSLV
jgi:hypothetical protein